MFCLACFYIALLVSVQCVFACVFVCSVFQDVCYVFLICLFVSVVLAGIRLSKPPPPHFCLGGLGLGSGLIFGTCMALLIPLFNFHVVDPDLSFCGGMCFLTRYSPDVFFFWGGSNNGT